MIRRSDLEPEQPKMRTRFPRETGRDTVELATDDPADPAATVAAAQRANTWQPPDLTDKVTTIRADFTTGTTRDGGSILTDLAHALRLLGDLEHGYQQGLGLLAAANATPEQIASYAIEDRIRRFPLTGAERFGAPQMGATSRDLGRAVIEALRTTGHLADPTSSPEPDDSAS